MYTEITGQDATVMQPEPIVATPEPVALKQDEPAGGKPQILDDVVIEEVSIDGMCGVY
jgi:mycofactocin precursor